VGRSTLRHRNFTAVLCVLVAVLSLLLVALEVHTAPQRRRQRPPRPPKVKRSAVAKVDYKNFSHTTHVVAQKLACSSCHKIPSKNWNEVRKGDAAFADVTDFPEHSTCLECHRTQFFARERPAPAICSNCHIAVTPRDTARWLFPSLGDLTDPKLRRRDVTSEFRVGFPHDKHIDVVSAFPISRRSIFAAAALRTQEKEPASCGVCHKTYQPQGDSNEEYVTKPPTTLGDAFWLKKGTFKTSPNSHTVCFTCHSVDSGLAPEPKDCQSCHKPIAAGEKVKVDFDSKLAADIGTADQEMLARWRRRISAGTFRHEGGLHPNVSCLSCHNAASATFNTADPRSMRVPVRSCGGEEGCHITATLAEGGALNSEIDSRKQDPKFVCTKCHVTFGKEALPQSHPQAIPAPKPQGKAG
jgi:hypothetical protein